MKRLMKYLLCILGMTASSCILEGAFTSSMDSRVFLERHSFIQATKKYYHEAEKIIYTLSKSSDDTYLLKVRYAWLLGQMAEERAQAAARNNRGSAYLIMWYYLQIQRKYDRAVVG